MIVPTDSVMDRKAEELPFSKIYDWFKEGVSVSKDALDASLKASVVFLVLPGTFLLTYLNHIGWKSLFFPAIASVQGLVTLLVATLLIFSLVLCIVCIPSMFLMSTVTWGKRTAIDQPHAMKIIVGTILVWIGVVLLSVTRINIPAPLLALTIFVICSGASTSVRLCPRKRESEIRYEIGGAVLFALVVTLASLASSVPFLTLIEFVGKMDTDASILHGLTVLIPMIVVGYLPGILAVSAGSKGSVARMVTAAVLGIFLVGYALMFWLVGFSTGLPAKVLNLIGVYQTNLVTFEITKADLVTQLKPARIVPEKSDPSLIQAYVRFAFGDIRLICLSPYDPAQQAPENIFHTPSQTERDDARAAGIQAGNACVVMKADELREVHS